MKYATVDLEGYIIGFYDIEVHDVIPEPNHEIDDTLWEEYLAGNLVKWDGNTWTSYIHDPIKDIPIEEVKQNKYTEIWNEADKRNVDSEKMFFTSGSETQRNNDRLKKKNDRIANKKIKGQATTPEEDIFIDQWDDCIDWQDSTNDIAEVACDAVENYTDKYSVDAYDVVNTPNWQAPFTL